MTYNSILQLTGTRKEIILSEKEAKILQGILDDKDYPKDQTIRLGGLSFSKGSVKYLEVNADGGGKDDQDQSMRKFYQEEQEKRKTYLSLPKERLSAITAIFEILYRVSANEEAKTDVIEAAKQIQLTFFKANPTRTICDLHLFKHLIPMKNTTMNVWESGTVKVIEKAVLRDMELSKK